MPVLGQCLELPPMRLLITLIAASIAFWPHPSVAEPFEREVDAILEEAGEGTRWGVVVADSTGTELLTMDPDGRFMPASNTKIFTTTAALWLASSGDGLTDRGGGASVRLVPSGRTGPPDAVLTGYGDAWMSGAADCASDCLSTLADAVAGRTREVHDVIGDATVFPDQRWSPGMSWNNIPTRSGTAISALSIDSNELAATISPGALGNPPEVDLPTYFTVENYARTVPGASEAITYDRVPGSQTLILTGTIGTESEPSRLRLGVDDPAHYAAWQLAEMLRVRGVRVSGNIDVRRRPLLPEDDPAIRGAAPAARVPEEPVLAYLIPPPLADDITLINQLSQNLHAELLLRRLGRIRGSGSIADGQAVIRAMLDEAGVAEHGVSLSDGSGMSSYNRVSPRSMVRLLTWVSGQPWGDQWRVTLPVGGKDGTLGRRFTDTALAGRISAKTGSINATRALAGYMTARSGRQLVFAIYANDVPDDVDATAIMDRALLQIAAAN
ncbi:MAG: D-alanyl-D-alanine carboxypeptidase/D-alanyl-D-alanine-endopeptidase [Allopontixanthobacter sediminis]